MRNRVIQSEKQKRLQAVITDVSGHKTAHNPCVMKQTQRNCSIFDGPDDSSEFNTCKEMIDTMTIH